MALRGNLMLNYANQQDATYPELPALIFGNFNSGEAITSQRGPVGNNRYGLDFYAGLQPRMSIANNGNVGIGTTTPAGKLDVDTGNGQIQFINDLVPGINITGGSLPGIIRLRNALEIWPSQDGSRAGYLDVRDTSGNPVIRFGGNGTATVKVLEITGGSDVAEPFPMAEENLEPGSVVVIDEKHAGRLTASREPYDTRVAGVISGANGVKPGLALRQEGVLDEGQNVALTGRVYVKADATHGAIKPGDLLTTSSMRGHAMRASDAARSHGAILGKAMTNLAEGQGMVLVLVSLQ